MKLFTFIFGVTLVVLLLSCSNSEREPDVPLKEYSNKIEKENEQEFIFVNDCQSQLYEAKLYEYTDLESDAFVLTVLFKNGVQKKDTLDLPTGRARIENCYDNYVLLTAACGGPCYGLDFVFLDNKRKFEGYMYCQVASSNEYIISYIENEEFEKLKIRNLQNGKEMTVVISNCEDLNSYPCQITNMNVIDNNLILGFDSTSDNPKQKSINIAKILN